MASNTLLDWIFGPSAEEIRLKRAERQLAAVKQEFSTYRSNEDQRRRASARSNAKTRRQLNIAQKALIADHGKLNTERRKLDEELDQLARKQGHIDTQRRQLEQEKHALHKLLFTTPYCRS